MYHRHWAAEVSANFGSSGKSTYSETESVSCRRISPITYGVSYCQYFVQSMRYGRCESSGYEHYAARGISRIKYKSILKRQVWQDFSKKPERILKSLTAIKCWSALLLYRVYCVGQAVSWKFKWKVKMFRNSLWHRLKRQYYKFIREWRSWLPAKPQRCRRLPTSWKWTVHTLPEHFSWQTLLRI